jgi:glyoxylase-like metal-dependent hydrolase (beta-lactamase superfamily II)
MTDAIKTADIQVSSTTINGDTGDLAAPADVASAAVPPVVAANLSEVTVENVSPGVWYLRGPSHHSVLAEFSDHLVLIESPQNEARAAAVFAKAKELKPDKPVRYLINTHHHFDHSGGIRTAMAEGATIITHEGNKAFLEAVAARPHTMTADALSQNPKQVTVEGVTDKRVLQDAMRTMEIYHMAGNAHSDTMLMVYFPAERLIVEADVYTPPAVPAPGAPPPAAPPVFPFAANFVENVAKLGLRPARLVPIHGRIVPYAEVQAAVGTSSD